MKAVLLQAYGGPEQLQYGEAEMPSFGDKEVLVRVRATSLNPIDWKIRSGAVKGRMPIELPAILGRDLSGEVADVGSGVTGFPKGMRVMALANHTYAEYTVVNAEALAPIPESLSFETAAALPLVTTTGTQLIERAVKPKPGQTLLVTGAVGGVGRTAVHVALKHGARVMAGVRARDRKDAAVLGAESIVAIDSEEEIRELKGLDAIADTVDGATIAMLLKSLRKGGVLGSVLGEPKEASQFDIRVQAFMAQPDGPRLSELAKEVAAGEFSIPIARVMPLDRIQEAHRLAEKGGLGGKIVLTC